MIKDITSELMSVDKITWGIYLLRRDPLYNKIPKGELKELILDANICGQQEAVSLRQAYGEKTCLEYATDFGLNITDAYDNNAFNYIIFAKFNSPSNIYLYRENINKARELMEKENIDIIDNGPGLDDILISHEMFHFIENNKRDIYTKNKKIQLWKLGPIKYKSELIGLGEIAAMAFTKELLKLPYYQAIINFILLFALDNDSAMKLYEEVLEIKGGNKFV